ncbi:MAG: ABC transporter ATP-binding protein [Candidatus Sedimenticola endophacoides]
MRKISRALSLLTPKEQRRGARLFIIVLLTAFLDAIGVASIMPFIAILSQPNLIQDNDILFFLFEHLGFERNIDFLLFAGISVFILLIISLTLRALVTYLQLRFTMFTECNLSRRLADYYLHQPYSWHICQNSANLSAKVLSEISIAVRGTMMPLLNVIAQTIIATAILLLLVIVHPVLAIATTAFLCSVYVMFYLLSASILVRIGHERLHANEGRYSAIKEAFGAIKQIKAGGQESAFMERFTKNAVMYAKRDSASQIIAQLPRFAIEGFAFGGLMLAIIYLMQSSDNFSEVLPIIALYAYAGYRLMPTLQQIYNNLSQLKFNFASLDAIHRDIVEMKDRPSPAGCTGELRFNGHITLNNVMYTYPEQEHTSLTSITLTIPKNSVTSLIGKTGSGKSTLIDLILGLLHPDSGTLSVDNQQITTTNRHQWQQMIGYAPQTVILLDDTITANIAFCINPEAIDKQAIYRAARIAELHDFIISDLEQGYDTRVGENGVRLSGGQRQRIGLARAIYHMPKVLILDEATSALDTQTEANVINNLMRIEQQMTILMCTHRISTIKNSAQIFVLDQGRIISSGSYSELLASNELFSELNLHTDMRQSM